MGFALLAAVGPGCGPGSDDAGADDDRPVVERAPNPRVADVATFALALGVDAGDPEVLAALADHDLVVVDGETTDAADVAALRDGGTIVLGYLSVGTLEPYRPWFAEAEARGWLLERWDRWDEWYAAVDQPGLRRLLLDEAERELATGFDGLFLDNTDLGETHPELADDMAELVRAVHDLVGDDRLLFTQNGDPFDPPLIDALDGWNLEDPSWTWDDDGYRAQPEAHRQAAIDQVERVATAGLLVTTTDYLDLADADAVDDAVGRACAAGAIPTVGPIELDRVPSPPVRCP